MKTDYLAGSYQLEDGVTLPYLWTSLHLNAQMEQECQQNDGLAREARRFEGEIGRLLRLLQDVSTQNWWELCTASGWTVYGAVGLSWCHGTQLDIVWSGWDAVRYDLRPGRVTERPCQFMNRDVLPASRRLGDIIAACDHRSLPSRVCLSALREEVIVDPDGERIAAGDRRLAEFVASLYTSGDLDFEKPSNRRAFQGNA